MLNLGRGVRWERDGRLRLVGLGFRAQLLPCAGNGEALFVKQFLDAEYALDIPLAVHALSRAALHRLQLRKLRFPETQHIGREATKRGDLSDTEIEFVGNENLIAFKFRRASFSHSHRLRGRGFPRGLPIVTQAEHRVAKFHALL